MIAHIRIVILTFSFVLCTPLLAMLASAQPFEDTRKRTAELSTSENSAKRVTREDTDNTHEIEESDQRQSEEEKLQKLNEFLQKRIRMSLDELICQPFNYNAAILPNGTTLLHCAVGHNIFSFVRNLIEKQGVLVNVCSTAGFTPLFIAVTIGNYEMVKYLLSKTASVYARDSNKKTVLHWAAEKGYPEIVELLFEFHAYVDAEASDGSTPLGLAALNGSFSCARLLLDAGASTNKPNNNKSTPLHLASSRGHSSIVELLLQYNADKTALDSAGKNPLQLASNMRIRKLLSPNQPPLTGLPLPTIICIANAVRNNDISTLRELHLYTKEFSYPIHIAVAADQGEAVKALLDNGASLEVVDQSHNTPLHTAIRKNHLEIAEYLIDTIIKRNQKELLNKKNKYNQTPLMVAAHICLPGTERIITRLLALGVNRTGYEESLPEFMRLIIAAAPAIAQSSQMNMTDRRNHTDENNNREVIDGNNKSEEERLQELSDYLQKNTEMSLEQIMTQPHFNPDAVLYEGATLLHYAANTGVLTLVRRLIDDYGAQLDIRSRRAWTPLHFAINSQQSAMVKFLLLRNASVNALSSTNKTPLHFAATLGNAEIVALLLAQSADLKTKSKNGYTPLHCAAEKSPAVVQLLLDAEPDVNDVTHDGKTALHIAAQQGSFECARLLLDRGAYVNSTDNHNQTPLHIASRQAYGALVELFLHYNADKEVVDKSNKTAWQLAPIMHIRKLLSDQSTTTLLPFLPTILAITSHLVAYGNAEVLRKYSSADINRCLSPLHLAIQVHQIEAVKYLLDNVSLDIVDHLGNTPLHTALVQNHIEIAELIIDILIKKNKRELLNKRNKAHQTPLMVAASICLPSTEPIINRLLDLHVDQTGYKEALPDYMRNIINMRE